MKSQYVNEHSTLKSKENVEKSQQVRIRQLTDENNQIRENMIKLELQIKQVELYKNQCSNLKKQLQLCEEKQKFYDSENERRQSMVEEQMDLFVAKEAKYVNEIEQKDEVIAELEKRLDMDAVKINEALVNSKKSQQEIQNLTAHIEELNKKIEVMENEKENEKMTFSEEHRLFEEHVTLAFTLSLKR